MNINHIIIIKYHCLGLFKMLIILLLLFLDELYASNEIKISSVTSNKALKDCKVPESKTTHYFSTLCAGYNYCELESGKLVPGNGTMVSLKCLDTYMLRNDNIDFIACYNGVWYPKQHDCLQTCKAMEYKTIDVNCTYKGKPVNCEKNIRIGTEVQWECKPGYGTDNKNKRNTCLKNREWKYNIYECFRVTCEGLNFQTIDAKCSHNGKSVDCTSLMPIGTKVEWKCIAGFQTENRNQSNHCLKNGGWQNPMFECTPENQLVKAIIDPRQNRTATVGSRMELHCYEKGYPPPNVTWLKHGKPVRYSKRVQLNVASIVSSDITSKPRKIYVLYINESTLEDSGEYQCKVENRHSTATSSTKITVLPKGHVSIDKTVERIVSPAGSDVMITCAVNAYPVPITIRWFKTHQQIFGSDDRMIITDRECTSPCTRKSSTCSDSYIHSCKSELNIRKAEVIDSGEYKCEALNDVASDQRFIDLKVFGPIQVKVQSFSNTYLIGRLIELNCEADGDPKPTIQWLVSTNNANQPQEITQTKNNGRISITEGNTTLQIRNSNTGDSGTYMCKASNKFSSETRKMSIEVFVTCPTLKFTNMEVNCFLNEKPVSCEENIRAGTMAVTKCKNGFQYDDSYGNPNYDKNTCLSNGHWEYPVSACTPVPRGPSAKITLDETTFPIRSTVKIPCHVDGYPEPVIDWYFDGRNIHESISWRNKEYATEDFGRILIIHDFKYFHTGEYKCEARNRLGEAYSSTSIGVKTDMRPNQDNHQHHQSRYEEHSSTGLITGLPNQNNHHHQISYEEHSSTGLKTGLPNQNNDHHRQSSFGEHSPIQHPPDLFDVQTSPKFPIHPFFPMNTSPSMGTRTVQHNFDTFSGKNHFMATKHHQQTKMIPNFFNEHENGI